MSGKRKSIAAGAVLILLLSLLPLFGEQNHQRMVSVHSPLFDAVKTLYLEAGIAAPSTAGPWSELQLLGMLERLDYDALSETGQRTYDRVEKDLLATLPWNLDKTISMGLGIDGTYEIYTHTDPVHFDDEWDWVYGYTERSPAALLSFDFSMHSWMYTHSELAYKKNRYAYDEDTQQVSSSLLYQPEFSTSIFDVRYIDFETPYSAYVALGGEGWNVQLGRDLLSWGSGRSGNLIIGDHLDYHDFFSFKSFHPNFDYQFLTVFIDYPGWDETGTDPRGEVPSAGVKAFLAHRLGFRFWEIFSLALSENVMYQHDFYDLRYFNPAYIFHNFNNREMFNAIASLELDVALLPGVALYGQFALDQARAPNENSSQPDAMGYLAGVDLTLPLSRGYLIGGLEFVYNDPYLYQRDLIDFKISRRQFTAIGGSFSTYRDFLGYRYGGDVQVFDILLGYREPMTGELLFGYRSIVHGDITIESEVAGPGQYDTPEDPTPHGDTPELRDILSLEGSLDITSLFNWESAVDLSALFGLYYITVENAGNLISDPVSDLQFVAGLTISL